MALDETATALRPDLVVLAAVSAALLSEPVEELRALAARFPLALAGAGAEEEIVARVGAIHLRQGPLDAAELLASRFLDQTSPDELRPSEPS